MECLLHFNDTFNLQILLHQATTTQTTTLIYVAPPYNLRANSVGVLTLLKSATVLHNVQASTLGTYRTRRTAVCEKQFEFELLRD